MALYPKRLIEVDLPIKQISEHARREKSIRHGHISTLHIWWARRPLVACRAVLCASLWPDPADEQCPQSFRDDAARILCDFAEKVRTDPEVLRLSHSHWTRWHRTNPTSLDSKLPQCWPDLRYALLDFIGDFANWDASTIPTFLETARSLTQAAHESLGGIPDTRPLVVDPFAGGGSIPLEALRIGADAFASDLNPVAVLLNKVVLEYIPKYGQQLADEVFKWGMLIKELAEQELAEFYPKDPDGAIPIAYLWARTITCEGPGCGAEVPLIRSLWLAKKVSNSVALRIIPNNEKKCVDFEIIQAAKAHDVADGTIRRGSVTCPVCSFITPVASIRKQLKTRHGGASSARLLAVVITYPGQQGRFFRLPTTLDLDVVSKAEKELGRRQQEYEGSCTLVPDEELPLMSGVFNAPIYGHDTWGSLFTPRQALALTTLIRLVRSTREKMIDEYDSHFIKAVQVCLSLVIDRVADRCSSLCRYDPSPTMSGINNTFARQALPMIWDFGEGIPTSSRSGGWEQSLGWLISVLEQEGRIIHVTGTVECASATSHPLPNDAAQAFVTDPPYYNAVPYADLSDFFYTWLKRAIQESYPSFFENELSPKADEICEMAGWDSNRYPHKDGNWFEQKMRLAMAEGCRMLAPNGIGLIVFAHKSTSGWEAQLQAMTDAGWTITGSWPIDTEMGTRLRAHDSAALASSIHLACRPRKNVDGTLRTDDVGDWRDVLHELPMRIHEWMPRLGQEGVVGADAIFACLGPALEIFSRYSRVERADGEQVTLKDYLEYVWAAVSKEALNMIFQGADTSGFDADARLTAMWLWTLSTNEPSKTNGQNNGKTKQLETEDLVDEEEISPKQVIAGYVLEFDAARKIAQGLGANLDKLSSLVEIKGSTARLRSVTERGRFLFDRNVSELQVTKSRRKSNLEQLAMFSVQELEAEFENANDTPAFNMGNTMLDRLHQAMLLFAAGRSDALKRFLTEEGVGNDQRFWRLAQALSSLYPPNSEERRWVEGVQGYKKGLGL